MEKNYRARRRTRVSECTSHLIRKQRYTYSNIKHGFAVIGPDVSVSIIHAVARSPRSIHFVLGCPPVHLMILHVWPTFFITFSCLLPTTHLLNVCDLDVELNFYICA